MLRRSQSNLFMNRPLNVRREFLIQKKSNHLEGGVIGNASASSFFFSVCTLHLTKYGLIYLNRVELVISAKLFKHHFLKINDLAMEKHASLL